MQEFAVTAEGLRDNTNLDKTYVVIHTPGKTAQQNYYSAINYIKESNSNNISTIRKIEKEYISFSTHVPHLLDVNNVLSFLPFAANYITELTFGNDSILFEITELDIYMKDYDYFHHKVIFSGRILSINNHAIYIGKKKSKIQQRMKQTKTDIEVYFNNQINLINNHFIESVHGCTDESACNYDSNANVDDGSCLTVYGCTDADAYNYNALANCDDGSCKAKIVEVKKIESKTEKENYAKQKTFSQQNKIESRNWYEGGTLHRSFVYEWRNSSYRNKLATCGDWMAKVDNSVTMSELKKRSKALLICIDEAVSMDATGQEVSGNLETVDIAVLCIKLLRY